MTENAPAIPDTIKCPACSRPMKRVKWELTNGLQEFNVYLEVQRVVMRCVHDNVALVLEAPTGEKSEYAR